MAKYSKLIADAKLIELYHKMYLARRFEERCGQAYGMGKIGGFCHLYIGQEAVIAGVYAVISEKDQVVTSYRDHAHAIFAGTDPKFVMAELFGKETGVSRGKGGSMHIFDLEKNFFGGHGIVGAQVPIGAGLAFANKYKNNGDVSVTFFGDGDSTLTALSTTTLSDAHIFHTYTLPGTYSVTQIMYNGATAVDTVTFNYVYNFCRTLPIRFYHDNNSNCIYDGADQLNVAAVSVRIDSNGVPVDTITATTGFFYKAYGAPGTVYAFRPYSVSGGLIVACPATTVIYDTIVSYTNTYQLKYFGVRCGAPTSGFDLKVNATSATGRHTQRFDIIVSNFYCSATSPVVKLTFSPKYGYFQLVYILSI